MNIVHTTKEPTPYVYRHFGVIYFKSLEISKLNSELCTFRIDEHANARLAWDAR